MKTHKALAALVLAHLDLQREFDAQVAGRKADAEHAASEVARINALLQSKDEAALREIRLREARDGHWTGQTKMLHEMAGLLLTLRRGEAANPALYEAAIPRVDALLREIDPAGNIVAT